MGIIDNIIENNKQKSDAEAYRKLLATKQQEDIIQQRVDEGLAASKADLINMILGGTDDEARRSIEFSRNLSLFTPEELQGLASSRASITNPRPPTSEYSTIMGMIKDNRMYNDNRSVLKPQEPTPEEAQFYADQGVDVMGNYASELDKYNEANRNANMYEKGIDSELAAKWRSSDY